MKTEAKVLIGSTVVGIALLAGLIMFHQASAPVNNAGIADSKILIRDDSNVSSTADAKVTIVEFGDYECPYCSVAAETLKKLVSDHNGQVKLVFRHFPLPQHTHAKLAAEAAEAAGEQGKFWEMNDKIYANQNQWVDNPQALNVFKDYATELGLDIDKFAQAVTNNKFSEKITKDTNDGLSLKINATPTLFINNMKYNGGLDPDSLEKAVKAELDK